MPKSKARFYLIHDGKINKDNSNNDMVFANAAVNLKLEPISELHRSKIYRAVISCGRLCRYVKSLFCIKLEIKCCYICREICWASVAL